MTHLSKTSLQSTIRVFPHALALFLIGFMHFIFQEEDNELAPQSDAAASQFEFNTNNLKTEQGFNF